MEHWNHCAVDYLKMIKWEVNNRIESAGKFWNSIKNRACCCLWDIFVCVMGTSNLDVGVYWVESCCLSCCTILLLLDAYFNFLLIYFFKKNKIKLCGLHKGLKCFYEGERLPSHMSSRVGRTFMTHKNLS